MPDPRVLNKLMSEVLCCFTENWNDSVQISNRSFAYFMRITKASLGPFQHQNFALIDELRGHRNTKFCRQANGEGVLFTAFLASEL